MHPRFQKLCHFKAVFSQRATKRTLACSVESGACRWMMLGNVSGVGRLIESLLDHDYPARPVMQKGAVAWGFLARCWEGSKTYLFIAGLHQSLTTHANIPVSDTETNELRDTKANRL